MCRHTRELYMCPHTTLYMCSHTYEGPYICVLILYLGPYMCRHTRELYMCPHTTICVLILENVHRYVPIYVSSLIHM